MDQRRFDALARSLAAPKSRRGVLGSLVALAAGLVGGRAAAAQVSQAFCGNVVCKNNPGICKPGCVCCVFSNGNSRCMPPGNCTGTIITPPSQGTCATGQDVCLDEVASCNGNDFCNCHTTTGGATVCGARAGECAVCHTDADCTGVTGPGSFCALNSGRLCQILCEHATTCVPPCLSGS